MKFPVFDLHCDTAYALLGSNFRQCGSLLENSYHIDLMRAGKLAGYAQCFACFTTPLETAVNPVDLFEREMATVMREVERNSDKISLAYCAQDVMDNYQNGKMSALLTIEGPAGFDYDPQLLPMLYQVGFRMTTLGWNESNPLTGSHLTGEGLTQQGRAYVRAAQDVGILVDVSHLSDQGFWDVIEITKAPIVASHSNSRTLCDHTRNLTDEMFIAICKTGGAVGINLYKDFIGGDGSLDRVCDHILHFMKMDPNAEHICLGGDLDGCDPLASGFTGVQDYDILAQKLLERGLSESAVMNIFWNNALGVLKHAVCNHEK